MCVHTCQVGHKAMGVACGGQGGVAVVRRQSVAWLAGVAGVEALVEVAMAAPKLQDLTQVS